MCLSGLGDFGFVFQWYWMLGYFCGLGECGCYHGLCKALDVSLDWFVWFISIDWVVWGISLTCFVWGRGAG